MSDESRFGRGLAYIGRNSLSLRRGRVNFGRETAVFRRKSAHFGCPILPTKKLSQKVGFTTLSDSL